MSHTPKSKPFSAEHKEVFVTKMNSAYCAVRTGTLNKRDYVTSFPKSYFYKYCVLVGHKVIFNS